MCQFPLRWIVVCCLLVAMFTMSAAAAPVAELAQPVIDIGHVAVDGRKEFTVDLRNAGDAPLEITRVQTSCPCAQSTLEGRRTSIPAGETASLPFVYVPDGRSVGEAGATIAITTNDPNNPALIAELVVFIDVPVIVRPATGVTWSMHPRGTRLSKELAVLPGTIGKDIQLTSVEVLDPAIGVVAERVETQREDGLETSIRFHFEIKPDAPLGPVATEVVARVIVDGEELEISAPVRGSIIGDTLVIPPSIISPKTAYKENDPISEIIVRPSGGGELHGIVNAIADGPLRVEVQPATASEQRVKVFAGDIESGGPQSGQIYVMTTSDDQPITVIPVYFRGAYPLEASPNQLTLEPGAPQPLRFTFDGRPAPIDALAFEYDANVLQLRTEHESVVVEAAAAPSGATATIITARLDSDAVTIPVLVRMP